MPKTHDVLIRRMRHDTFATIRRYSKRRKQYQYESINEILDEWASRYRVIEFQIELAKAERGAKPKGA